MTMNTETSTTSEEYSLPCAEALLAGTLALMTGYAQGCCDSHHDAMGRKIVANLQSLSRLESLTPHFRTMLWNLQARWCQHCENLANAAKPGDGAAATGREVQGSAEQRRMLWHAAPEAVQ